jgi:uncharacterized protein
MTTTDEPLRISSTPERADPRPTEPRRGRSARRPPAEPSEGAGGPTMPAGRVLGVMVLGLALAGLLNADAIQRRAAGENVPEWRQWVADTTQSVSDALFLNRPREAIDEALDRDHGDASVSAEDLAAERADAAGGGTTVPSTATDDGGSGTTASTVPPDTPPALRAPTPDAPLRVWVGGDSMSDAVADSVKAVFEPTGIFSVTTDSQVSTGLTRPDFFNWPQHLAEEVVPLDGATGKEPADAFELVIIMFGANDSQNMPLPDGGGYERLSPEWLAEYRKRVGDTMDLLRHADDQRVVLWVGQPIMGPGSGVRGMDQLNHIYWEEASSRPWIVYFDTWVFFSDASGAYADELPSADGTPRSLRAKDDIHFSVSGGNRLAWALLGRIGQLADLSAWGGTPDLTQAPPPDVAERAEVPPTSPGGEG